MKPNTSHIMQICESFETTEKEAATAEAAVISAKEACKAAAIDDGKTDPEKIHERKAAAKKLLFIRETEAKRAAAKLEAAKPEFEKSIESLTTPLLESLAIKRAHNAEELTKELAPKTSQHSELAPTSMRNFIACCKGVAEFDIVIGSIHHGIQRLPAYGAKASGLIRALKEAESLI